MRGRGSLVGRKAELEQLGEAVDRARAGTGSLVLVAGEAGVGKTRLLGELARASDATTLWGRASQGAAAPYGPIVGALRSFLRVNPDGLGGVGALKSHLALLLPELGKPARGGDRAALFEAVRCALERAAGDGPLIVVLDDLQWSDDTTLELLPALAEPLAEMPVLLIAAYRSDGLPRGHLLRRLRHELRRGGRLEELTVPALDSEEVAELLQEVLDAAPAPSLTRTIHDRTQGVTFFVEELAHALTLTGSLTEGRRGLELAKGGEVPVPDTVRDAVLIGASELSPDARRAAEAAATAGEEFDLELVASASSEAGLQELIESGIVVEGDTPDRGAFRRALAREALYADIPWLQRRALHRQLGEALEVAGASSLEVATHWLSAREDGRARQALLRAAAESRALHAYRDAARAWRQALELWPDGEDEEARLEALEAYAGSAELAGQLAEALRAWREICSLCAENGAPEEVAAAQRRLAGVHDLRGERDQALATRVSAAETYAASGKRAEAAVERLAIANYLRSSAKYSEAIAAAQAAAGDAKAARRRDLRARALGLEGLARAKGGDFDEGLATVRAGLSLALEHELTPVAAELYQRLSVVLYDSADYRRAQETLDTALALCEKTDEPATEVACVTCMVYVLRECGEWDKALTLGQELIASRTAVWVSEGLLGAIHAAQGKLSSARRLLSSSLATASQVGHYNMTVDTTTGLARVAAADDASDEAANRLRSVLALWENSEDHHYAITGLRFGASFFARRGELREAHACAEALTRIASETGHGDVVAALAQAIGETALANHDPETAAEQLTHAVDVHRTLDLPFERAEIELRAGVALAAAGEREAALERLGDAYRTARKLGARPLAAEAAREVAALGESVVRRLGRRAEADAEGAGLSRRELEVVRHVAAGRTNREIAKELFLSPRTVDMHVRNILRKLQCRSRVEAATRAGELGLLDPRPALSDPG